MCMFGPTWIDWMESGASLFAFLSHIDLWTLVGTLWGIILEYCGSILVPVFWQCRTLSSILYGLRCIAICLQCCGNRSSLFRCECLTFGSYTQIRADTLRYIQIRPDTPRYAQIFKICEDTSKYIQIRPYMQDISRYTHIWSHTPVMCRYAQICADMPRYARYKQIRSDISKYAQIWSDAHTSNNKGFARWCANEEVTNTASKIMAKNTSETMEHLYKIHDRKNDAHGIENESKKGGTIVQHRSPN